MKRDAKFLKLQKKWYEKLLEDGFTDIEWTRSQKSFDQNSPYLHGFRERQDRPTFEHTQNWYLLVQNYRTHAISLPKTSTKVLKREIKPGQKLWKHWKLTSPDSNIATRTYQIHSRIPRMHKLILDLYIEGIPYRAIADQISRNYSTRLKKLVHPKKKLPKKPLINYLKVFYILQQHLPYVIQWNKTHPEGRLYGNHDDFYAEEVLLNEDRFQKTGNQ